MSEPRKPWYGDGEQPWDVIVRLGWAPGFAAGNVLKYLRRSKKPEHSLESARWYYSRLLDMKQAGEPGMYEVLGKLYDELTKDERAKICVKSGERAG